jgi:uncharacterized damage-inducible protein DinB
METMKQFESIANEIISLTNEWAEKLSLLSEEQITVPRNSQNRTIKQILGHMADSASNNTHRVIHLQYRESPVEYPNYATNGNNDRWIAIQNYQEENWENLVQFWKYSNLHYAHVIQQINPEKLENKWMADKYEKVSLLKMVEDYPRHFKLHLSEIEGLLK